MPQLILLLQRFIKQISSVCDVALYKPFQFKKAQVFSLPVIKPCCWMSWLKPGSFNLDYPISSPHSSPLNQILKPDLLQVWPPRSRDNRPDSTQLSCGNKKSARKKAESDKCTFSTYKPHFHQTENTFMFFNANSIPQYQNCLLGTVAHLLKQVRIYNRSHLCTKSMHALRFPILYVQPTRVIHLSIEYSRNARPQSELMNNYMQSIGLHPSILYDQNFVRKKMNTEHIHTHQGLSDEGCRGYMEVNKTNTR